MYLSDKRIWLKKKKKKKKSHITATGLFFFLTRKLKNSQEKAYNDYNIISNKYFLAFHNLAWFIELPQKPTPVQAQLCNILTKSVFVLIFKYIIYFYHRQSINFVHYCT